MKVVEKGDWTSQILTFCYAGEGYSCNIVLNMGEEVDDTPPPFPYPLYN